MVQSETAIGSVPTAADTWTDISTFTVPAGVKRLVKVKAGIAPDTGATGTVRVAPVIRMIGSGLLEQSPHEYVLQGVNIGLATSGAASVEPAISEFDLDIAVQTGGQITVQINCLDEVPAALTSRVELDYDDVAPGGLNQMSQYVDAAAPAAAGAWTTVGTITIPQLAAGKAPEKIRELRCGIVSDVAATFLVRNSNRFRLSGSGLKEAGLHQYLGSQSGDMFTTPGAVSYDRAIVTHKTVIPVNAGGQILVECISDVENLAGGTAVLGVLYG